MATKKKTGKKQTKSKTNAGKKTASKKVVKKKAVQKKIVAKKIAGKKIARKKTVAQKTAPKKMVASRKKGAVPKKPVRSKSRVDTVTFPLEEPTSRPRGQSGDLEGLSNLEGADSESVQELLEEGNAFEAEVVTGVENAGNSGTREVHTREVPEDDVPEEYLDNEK